MAIQIKNLLRGSLIRTGASKEVNAAIVCNEFNKITLAVIGDKAKGKFEAKYVKNGTLAVAVLSPVMSQEIKLHEAEIMEKLYKKVDKNQVNSLRFLV